MFTGVIEASCPIRAAERGEGRVRLSVDLAGLPGEGPAAAPGDSIALNGVCLTVAELKGSVAAFDVIPETLSRTNLGELGPSDRLHAERALRLGDRLDGHLVQGHIETTGTVRRADPQEGQLWLEIDAAPAFLARCLPKGSITVDGVSLTIAALAEDHFAVALVPHTLQITILGERKPGDRVNLEPDQIGQWVARLMQERGVGG